MAKKPSGFATPPLAKAAVTDQLSPASMDWASLPSAVARLRARILQSVAGGNIEDLLIPIQWNEVRPLFIRDQPQFFDPIAFLKQRSFDGRGREMLRILGAVLRQPFALSRRGIVTSVVWPQFPVTPEREPTARERLAPWMCVRFADLDGRTKTGGLAIHRVAIGLDGTWQFFWPDV